MKILVINAGSSSLKYQLFEMKETGGQVLAKGICDRIGLEHSLVEQKVDGKKFKQELELKNHSDAIRELIKMLTTGESKVINDMKEIEAVGHRVVHGGEKFSESVLIDEVVKAAIKDCYQLAPLHNPANMTGIEACEAAMPNVPMVAVFDTAFHQSMPAKSYRYALAEEYYQEDSIRRYGFHGTSHAFVAKRAAELVGKDIKDLKMITCHLGNGSSITAVDGGKSIDTSMGMTPLAGVPMGTRSGDLDPAIVLYLLKEKNLTVDELDTILNKKSGMLGVSGTSSDFRDLWDSSDAGDQKASLALDLFIYACRKTIGSYITALGGLDLIVFTAGIGENDHLVREGVLTGLERLGILFDSEVNSKTRGVEQELSKPGSEVKVWVVPTDEELAIAQQTAALVK